MKKFSLLIFFVFGLLHAQKSEPVFSFGGDQFLLRGKPFRIISGEMHPARIPKEYWRHRIQMAKAMGCNTIDRA
jgi:beta-galactosidase